MAERAVERVTAEAFLAWTEGREGRFELVDGVVVAMAGAKRAHDRIVINVMFLLRSQLSGKVCEPFSADTFVRIPTGNYRMPDAGVDCGTADRDDRWAREPRLVVEVLSPSTRDFDMFGKLDEYRSVVGLEYVLLIDPDAPQATLWSRGDGGWTHETVRGLEAVVAMPGLELVLPMAEVYARVGFPAGPWLVS